MRRNHNKTYNKRKEEKYDGKVGGDGGKEGEDYVANAAIHGRTLSQRHGRQEALLHQERETLVHAGIQRPNVGCPVAVNETALEREKARKELF